MGQGPTVSTCSTSSSGSSGAASPGGWGLDTVGVAGPRVPSSPGARSSTMPEFCMAWCRRFSRLPSLEQGSSWGPGGCRGGRGRGLARWSNIRHRLLAPQRAAPRPCAHLAPSLRKAPCTCPRPSPLPFTPPCYDLGLSSPFPHNQTERRKAGPGQSHSQQSRHPEQGPD